ncbi:conserved hypothetical protein [Gloeothece citriformis PCC 7424]|uniref:Uncharacterized protein n=1 Tax=Gloeothece citriformis (strain PCC 7424) TaxID=65393 RepID=B7K7I8_GLOC7|nr:hypothetical protein [Gloeothece citriformis]ACK69756.1 conserved hypothetical protein [Gloeothece citriformis PCC 7424]
MKTMNYGLSEGLKKGAIALVIVTGFIGGCSYNQEEAVNDETGLTPDTEITQPELAQRAELTNVELGNLTGNVDEYLGRTVSVRGEAEQAVGETGFLLQDDQLFGGDEVLVINASGDAFFLPGDDPTDEVQVTGEVRQFVRADIERDYNLILDPNIYVEYEDRPVIIAESIALAPDPEEVSENPQAFYNQEIAVTGEIGEQLAPNTFTLQEEQLFGGEEILVISANPAITLDQEEEVVVTGTLRQYVQADFERDYDLTWDLDLQRQIEAEYTDRPVLVADDIYPSAE